MSGPIYIGKGGTLIEMMARKNGKKQRPDLQISKSGVLYGQFLIAESREWYIHQECSAKVEPATVLPYYCASPGKTGDGGCHPTAKRR